MRLKRIFGDSLVYGATSYLLVLSGIILTPVYTRIFTKAEYGMLDIFNTWNVFVAAILPLGLITSIQRFYPDIVGNYEDKRTTLGTILSTICFMGVLYVIFMLLIKSLFINYIGVSNVDEIYYHSIYIVLTGLFIAYSKVVLQSKFQKYRYVTLSVVNFLILSLLGFVFVYYYGMRIVGFYRASSISMTVTVLLGIFLIKNEIFFKFDKPVLKKLLTYSIHFISVFFLFQAVNIVDRVILLEFGSLPDVGVYNIGTKISGITKILFSAFATAWFPIAMSIKDKPDSKETYRKVHNVYFIISFIFLFSLFLFRKELIFIFAPTYSASYNIIGILALAYLVNGSVYLYALGIHIKNKTKYFSVAAIISIVINVVSSILLMIIIGIDGVAWGTLLGGIAWIVVQIVLIKKYYKIKFDYWLAVGVIVILIFLMYFTSFIDNQFSTEDTLIVVIKLLFLLILSTIIFLFARKRLRDIKVK